MNGSDSNCLTQDQARIRELEDEVKALRRELEHERDYYHQSEKLAKLGSWKWNLKDGSSHWSPGLYDIYGFKPEHGVPDAEAGFKQILEEDLQKVIDAIEESKRTGHYACELRIRRYDTGEVRWLNAVGAVDYDTSGEAVTHYGVTRDITEDRLFAQRLEQNEQRLRMALTASRMGVWSWEMASGQVQWSSEVFQIFGQDPERFQPDYNSYRSFVYKADIPQLDEALQSCIGEEAASSNYFVQHRIFLPNGGIRWIEARGEVIRDGSGAAVGMHGTVLDITDLKRSDRRNELMRLSLEHSQSMVLWADLQGQIQYANDALCKVTGYSEQAIRRLQISDIDSDHTPEQVLEVMQAIRQQGSLKFDTTLQRADHSTLPVHVSVNHLELDGESAVFAIITDLSQRQLEASHLRKAKEAAEAAAKTREEFIAVLSHELRTPLNPILGLTELLLTENKDEEQRECLRNIYKSGRRMLEMVEEILYYTSLTHDKQSGRRLEPGHLPTLIRRQCETIDERLGSNRLFVDASIGQLPSALCDDEALERVLRLILDNACKFTTEGSITLAARQFQKQGIEWICISISDTGIGIEAQKHDLIFEPFSQGDSSMRRRHNGVGIGLATCRKLMQRMGGEILVQSEPGRGSRFEIHFPIQLPSS